MKSTEAIFKKFLSENRICQVKCLVHAHVILGCFSYLQYLRSARFDHLERVYEIGTYWESHVRGEGKNS